MKKRPYETMVVFDGTLSEDVLHKEQKQIEELISRYADFEKTDVWGKRTLAYPIRKKQTGYYCLFLYSGTGEVVNILDKHFKLSDTVLRYLTVVRNLKNEEARKKRLLQAEAVALEEENVSIDNPAASGDRDDDIENYDAREI